MDEKNDNYILMKYVDSELCKSRLFCDLCKLNSGFRSRVSKEYEDFPETCPFVNIVPSDLSEEEKKAICILCPSYGKSDCCGCSSARMAPWSEFKICRKGKWIKPQV